MTWEHFEVTYSGPVLVQATARGLVEQGWLVLATVSTGKTRTPQGYACSVVVHQREYRGVSSYTVREALQACAATLQQHQMALLCAGLGEGFSESGLSSGTGYGYIRNGRQAVHLSSQGYASIFEPDNVKAQSLLPTPSAPGVIHYFAYGSNMSFEQMALRCPGATCAGSAVILGLEYRINSHGVATLVPSPGKSVHGAVWLLTPEHEHTLDAYEGVPTYYRPFFASLHAGRTALETLIYLANDATPGVARDGYQEKIVAAARHLGLPADYVGELESWLPLANRTQD